jgi:uracil phosphoribosyltransferase
MSMSLRVVVPPHPLIGHWLTLLRDGATPSPLFATAMAELGRWLTYESLRDWLPHRRVTVETPLGRSEGQVVDPEIPLLVIPVLREGLGLWQGGQSVLPSAQLAHVGIEPCGPEHKPHWFLDDLPATIDPRSGVLVFLPCLASGSILLALLDRLQVEGDAALAVLRTVDKLPKLGEAATRDLLRDENGLAPAAIDTVFDFLALKAEVPGTLEAFFEGHAVGLQGASELRAVLDAAAEQGCGDCVAVDLSIARGLDYYTGTIYETFLLDLEAIGSVMSGGRYDTLLGIFTGEAIPAVGISLGVDRLFYGLQELGLVASRSSPTQVLVTVFDDTVRARSYAIAQTLRSAGFSVEVFLGAGKLKKQFTYADRKQIPWVVVAGPDELARDEATLKNLRTGEQHVLPILALAERLRQP